MIIERRKEIFVCGTNKSLIGDTVRYIYISKKISILTIATIILAILFFNPKMCPTMSVATFFRYYFDRF
jgi:hypothetical protein